MSKSQPRARVGGRPSQRAEILAAAVDLFAKGGSRGISMSAIAKRTGVSIPAITHHFGSKNGLFQEVVAVSDEVDERRVLVGGGGSGTEQFGATRRWSRELTSDASLANLARLALVMTVEALDPDFPAHDHFVARHRRFRGLVTQSIANGQREGSVRLDVDSALLAVEILAFVQGATLQWFLDPGAVDLVAVYDRYFDRLISDLVPSRIVRPSRGRTRAKS